jgi:hypothetical protein
MMINDNGPCHRSTFVSLLADFLKGHLSLIMFDVWEENRRFFRSVLKA